MAAALLKLPVAIVSLRPRPVRLLRVPRDGPLRQRQLRGGSEMGPRLGKREPGLYLDTPWAHRRPCGPRSPRGGARDRQAFVGAGSEFSGKYLCQHHDPILRSDSSRGLRGTSAQGRITGVNARASDGLDPREDDMRGGIGPADGMDGMDGMD